MRRALVQFCIAVMLALPLAHAAHAGNAPQVGQAAGIAVTLGNFPSEVASETGSGGRSEVKVRHCHVTSIHDGDSMRLRCPGFKETLRVRLHQIDAPELEQAYGVRSRDVLRSICPKGQKAVLHDLGADDYNRRLGRVFCNDVDVNAAMVETGAAWVYDYHASDQHLYSLQTQAQSKKRGLWARSGKPLAPWDFRYQQRRQGNR